MTRVSGIAGAFVVTLALAPISADAQQIFACVNATSGAVRIVAQCLSQKLDGGASTPRPATDAERKEGMPWQQKPLPPPILSSD